MCLSAAPDFDHTLSNHKYEEKVHHALFCIDNTMITQGVSCFRPAVHSLLLLHSWYLLWIVPIYRPPFLPLCCPLPSPRCPSYPFTTPGCISLWHQFYLWTRCFQLFRYCSMQILKTNNDKFPVDSWHADVQGAVYKPGPGGR